ncbi:unnamed protein product [Penicillium olsonii]|nr:unnamed protein product [Penicillium olsonii]
MDGEIPLPPPRRIRYRSPALPARSATNAVSSLHRTRRLSRFDDCSSQPSSDPALFSSDDIPASGLENYHATTPGSGRKRRYRGTWWGEQVIDPKRKRGEFKEKRNVDSGVWMGSDESGAESIMSSDPAWGEDLRKTVLDPMHTPTPTTPKASSANTRDPDNTPIQVRAAFRSMAESQAHQLARKTVNECLEKGHESIDLGYVLSSYLSFVPTIIRPITRSNKCPASSDYQLQTLPPGLLKPLKHFTKLPPVGEAPVSEDVFTSLKPSLSLYLPNNSLSTLPSDIYELSNLKVLSLRNNKLTEIPLAICRLTGLQVLNASVNELTYLPWELICMIFRGELKHVTVRPNPFPTIDERHIQWNSDKKRKKAWEGPMEFQPGQDVDYGYYPIHVGSGPITFLDKEGKPVRVVSRREASLQVESPLNEPPSLRELALRAVTKLPYLEETTDEELAEYPPPLVPLLRKARQVRIAGGQMCSVCDREYVIPRTEWTEWWDITPSENGTKTPRVAGQKLRPLPFRRYGCRQACVPDACEKIFGPVRY